MLFEGYKKSARGYVELAKEVNGPIPKPVGFSYICGDALSELERRKHDDVRIINPETTVTRSDDVENKESITCGCGDLLNDYEGISGHEAYRSDLSLMYFVRSDASAGKLVSLFMTSKQIKLFRLNHTVENDALWLRDILNREGKKIGTSVDLQSANTLMPKWVSSNQEEPRLKVVQLPVG